MSLLLILPVCAKDEHLAVPLVECVAELGACRNHHLHVLIDTNVSPDADANLFRAWDRCFDQREHSRIHIDAAWPIGANGVFANASFIAESRGLPWYFFEPDNTPMREGWLDEIEDEYRSCGKPFMGAVEQAWLVSPTTKQRFPHHTYMMGSGIYPADLRRHTLSHLRCGQKPFDVAMGMDIARSVHPTDLIANCWQTQNYRMSKDHIGLSVAHLSFDACAHGRDGESMVRKFSAQAAVVHGCKDSSLLNLLKANRALPSAPCQPMPSKTTVPI